MQYYVTQNTIHIYDSYIYGKSGFQSRLELIQENYPDCLVFKHRSFWHLKMEWAVHNFLFKLGLWRDRVGDVDLDWPLQKWYRGILYSILGPVAWLFID